MTARFWSKVERGAQHQCWNWTGARRRGYGLFNRAGRMVSAHRFAWELINGSLPDGAILMHSCDNRGCVNPAHLTIGTHLNNVHDMIVKGRDRCTGDRHSRRKLSRHDVQGMLLLRATTTLSLADIARLHGVARSRASDVIHGKGWRRRSYDFAPVGAQRTMNSRAPGEMLVAEP